MLTGLHHTSLSVSSLDRALEFYEGLLGLELIVRQGGSPAHFAVATGYEGAELHWAHLRAPDCDVRLELIEYRNPPAGRAPETIRNTFTPGNAHWAFQVDDIWAAYEKLSGRGVEFKSRPVEIPSGVNKGGYTVYFFDPDGITVEMLQPPVKEGRSGY